jgi:hypothetical protein
MQFMIGLRGSGAKIAVFVAELVSGFVAKSTLSSSSN